VRTTRSAEAGTGPDLPAWPFYVLFVGYPLWWVLGLGGFALALTAVPMAVLLCIRRNVRMPRGFVLWLLFVLWACFAAVEVQGSLRLIGFAVRLSTYAGATLVFLYIYNSTQRTLPTRRVLLGLAAFFGFVVIGGYLGLLLPRVTLSTPVARVLPAAIAQNEYVHALVNPTFAEVQQPYGSPRTFYRPSAPFPYTNSWGCNVSLLVPLVLATVSTVGRGRVRLLLIGTLAAASVPAFATLNRGMFLAVGLGLAYASIRLALRGRLVPLVAILVSAMSGVVIAVATGVTSSLSERLHYSQTNVGRQTIYREAYDGALASPVFGNGSPKPSETLDISIGTQGQVWNVMFSYGFPALFFFLAWFVVAAWCTRALPTQASLFVHVTLVVVLLTVFFYGYDGMQLAVAMAAAGVAMRGVEEAEAPVAVREPQRAPVVHRA
jgi:hypothetical protein